MKRPLVGERLLIDIAGRFHLSDHVVLEEVFYQINFVGTHTFSCIKLNNMKPMFVLFLSDIKWLKEHQIWVLKDGVGCGQKVQSW